MKRDRDFHNYLMSDVFVGIEGITSKPMFGGFGFYRNGIIFGIIADGNLYFKVGDSNKKDYEEYGSKPFTYPMKNGPLRQSDSEARKTTTISYWEVPADILENKDELERWINKSCMIRLSKKKT